MKNIKLFSAVIALITAAGITTSHAASLPPEPVKTSFVSSTTIPDTPFFVDMDTTETNTSVVSEVSPEMEVDENGLIIIIWL